MYIFHKYWMTQFFFSFLRFLHFVFRTILYVDVFSDACICICKIGSVYFCLLVMLCYVRFDVFIFICITKHRCTGFMWRNTNPFSMMTPLLNDDGSSDMDKGDRGDVEVVPSHWNRLSSLLFIRRPNNVFWSVDDVHHPPSQRATWSDPSTSLVTFWDEHVWWLV